MRTIFEDRASRDDALKEWFQTERREFGIKWTDKVFVEPLSFFDLETYAFEFDEFFLWNVDDEPDAEVIEP